MCCAVKNELITGESFTCLKRKVNRGKETSIGNLQGETEVVLSLYDAELLLMDRN